jgi:hypothetical protein
METVYERRLIDEAIASLDAAKKAALERDLPTASEHACFAWDNLRTLCGKKRRW